MTFILQTGQNPDVASAFTGSVMLGRQEDSRRHKAKGNSMAGAWARPIASRTLRQDFDCRPII
ncbi:MAG TPA: hypothetical protein VNI02_05450 [Blastocatellia bacterium]|nr:hypothetical protein [Blastocatellia bacterium]